MQTHDYRRDIDGLRAIAVGLVVLFHAFPSLLPGGFLGVDIFFVISGFLITGNIIKDLQRGSFSFLRFYGKRCRRILPALFTVLVLVLGLGYCCLDGIAFMKLGKHTMAGAGFVSNLVLLRESGYFDRSSELKPLLHLWSLSVEEQFYFAWPILAMFSFAHPRIWAKFSIALALLSFAFCLHWSWSYPSLAFYSIASRFWELAVGCGLAFCWTRLHVPLSARTKDLLSLLAIGLFLLCEILMEKNSVSPGYWALAPSLGALLLLLAGKDAWVNRRILASKPMVFVGLISYPLYLWHWPLLAILRASNGAEPKYYLLLVVILASVFLAILTRKWIELPVQHYFSFREQRFSKSPLFALLISAGISVAIACTGWLVFREKIVSLDRMRHPDEFRLQRYSLYELKNIRLGNCFLDSTKPFTGYSKDCYLQKNLGQPSVLLLGDSLAAHLYPGLEEVLSPKNIETLQLTASSCPPLAEVGEDRPASCVEASRFILETIKRIRPQTVILMANWLAYEKSSGFTSRLLESIHSFQRLGVQTIIVVGMTPIYQLPPNQILVDNYSKRKLPLPLKLKLGLDERIFATNTRLKHSLAAENIHYIDVLNSLCDDAGCLSFVGPNINTDILLYDEDHLTAPAAKYVSEQFIYPVLNGLR